MNDIAESRIIELFKEHEILTGSELSSRTDSDIFTLWRSCRQCAALEMITVGRRYLRLDKAIPQFARLSPSIMREFLTYTIMGLIEDSEMLRIKAGEAEETIRAISREKHRLALEVVAETVAESGLGDEIQEKACFIIAGDVVFEMAHTEPRPEKSTGKMVRGSDLDIIVVTNDDLDQDKFQRLDQTIYQKKYVLLVHPGYREELDYIIKPLNRVKRQLQFDTFEHMVAGKILDEGQFLYGNKELFQNIKDMLLEVGIPNRLQCMEERAKERREDVEKILLEKPESLSEPEFEILFYYKEEAEEIF